MSRIAGLGVEAAATTGSGAAFSRAAAEQCGGSLTVRLEAVHAAAPAALSEASAMSCSGLEVHSGVPVGG